MTERSPEMNGGPIVSVRLSHVGFYKSRYYLGLRDIALGSYMIMTALFKKTSSFSKIARFCWQSVKYKF